MSFWVCRINEAKVHGMRYRRIRRVDGDGNCLFRAASVALSGNFDMSTDEEDERAEQLRSAVVAFMRVNKTTFESFMECDFDEYVRAMQQNCEWGGELELSAIARMTRRPVQVCTRNRAVCVCAAGAPACACLDTCDEVAILKTYPTGAEACTNAIKLLFHGRHYDALLV
jgi:hypothetical protein